VMWLSTVLLRFHYFVDLLGGLAVAACGWWVLRRYERREHQAGSRITA
jgi:membrane-associated phospholipid phosphatase